MANGGGDPETLREEIRRTRVELGETVEALAARVDVRARLKESAEQARQRMRHQAGRTLAGLRGRVGRAEHGSGPLPWAVVAVGGLAVAVVLIVRGRRG